MDGKRDGTGISWLKCRREEDLTMAYDKRAMRDFADRWKGCGYEKGETQQFWLQVLRVIGYPHVDDVLFEYGLPSGGFIDVWVRDADVLIEWE